jgi:hypothetical protein
MVFSEISVKAATVTGAILGLLCALLAIVFSVGMMPMYSMMRYSMMGYAYLDFGLVSIIVLPVYGAIVGALVGIIYNWALKQFS